MGTQKGGGGGFPQKRGGGGKGGGGSNPGGNCGITLNLHYYGTKTRAAFSKHLHL